MVVLFDPLTYLIILGILATIGGAVRVVIVCVSLKGTNPNERPAILNTLPSIFKAFKHDWSPIARALANRRAVRQTNTNPPVDRNEVHRVSSPQPGPTEPSNFVPPGRRR